MQARGSITTSDRVTPDRRRIRTTGDRRLPRANRIEQFATGKEHDARAGQRQEIAAEAWIDLHVVAAAFDRAEGDGIDHQPRFEACLDDEESTDLAQHAHSLTFERIERGFEPSSS
jgi:hypothetical protein